MLYQFPFTTMGSACNLHIYAENSAAADQAMQATIAETLRLEARYSRYRPDSLLSGQNGTVILPDSGRSFSPRSRPVSPESISNCHCPFRHNQSLRTNWGRGYSFLGIPLTV